MQAEAVDMINKVSAGFKNLKIKEILNKLWFNIQCIYDGLIQMCAKIKLLLVTQQRKWKKLIGKIRDWTNI